MDPDAATAAFSCLFRGGIVEALGSAGHDVPTSFKEYKASIARFAA